MNMTTKSHRVNYDAVAPKYDDRAKKGYLSGAREALQDLARQVNARRVLDLGCGTGRSLQTLAGSLQPAPLRYGLDFSGGMLTQAYQLNSDYRLVQASAPWPPFAPATFDLVFCAHAFHHFPNKPHVVQAAYKLLRPGGVFAMVNFDPREGDWYVYTYFEGTYETDLQRFPAIAEKEAMLIKAGFQQVSSPVVQHIDGCEVGEGILSSYYLRKDASSQLILTSDEVYQAGVVRIKAAIAEVKAKAEEITFSIQLKNRMCHGFKPK